MAIFDGYCRRDGGTDSIGCVCFELIEMPPVGKPMRDEVCARDGAGFVRHAIRIQHNLLPYSRDTETHDTAPHSTVESDTEDR